MPDNNITQWEYKVIEQNTSKEAAINEQELRALGEKGWEVTGVLPSNSCNTNQTILKRPKRNYDNGYSR